jgi:muramoyltetrapeptide carboxypeptidase
LAGKLDTVRGVVFGEMKDCLQTANQGYTLREVLMRIVGQLGVPVACGARSGHVTAANITLPIGARARLNVSDDRVSLRILEAAVTSEKR